MLHGEGIATDCLNCGAPLHGPFCAHCGQRAVAPRPTLHHFLHLLYPILVLVAIASIGLLGLSH